MVPAPCRSLGESRVCVVGENDPLAPTIPLVPPLVVDATHGERERTMEKSVARVIPRDRVAGVARRCSTFLDRSGRAVFVATARGRPPAREAVGSSSGSPLVAERRRGGPALGERGASSSHDPASRCGASRPRSTPARRFLFVAPGAPGSWAGCARSPPRAAYSCLSRRAPSWVHARAALRLHFVHPSGAGTRETLALLSADRIAIRRLRRSQPRC
jgi:hypothetical protein